MKSRPVPLTALIFPVVEEPSLKLCYVIDDYEEFIDQQLPEKILRDHLLTKICRHTDTLTKKGHVIQTWPLEVNSNTLLNVSYLFFGLV